MYGHNRKKVAGVSYEIRGRTTIVIFSPWNYDFLKPRVPQGVALPGHGVLRHLGFKLFTWRKPRGNTEHKGMAQRVAFVKMQQSHQALIALVTTPPLRNPNLEGLY